MDSLDPRVNRLPEIGEKNALPKAALDQFGTFEVFVRPKEGKSFQHEGIVHAPNLELAFVLAKEGFTRRFTCTSLLVVDTRNVFCSPMTEGDTNAYDLIQESTVQSGVKTSFEVFQLTKRGKQHVQAGTVLARGPEEAMAMAKRQFHSDKVVYSVWAIPAEAIRFTIPEETDLWVTLPEKKFRDASEYKGGDRLRKYLENVKNSEA